jgi:hypothetical protein
MRTSVHTFEHVSARFRKSSPLAAGAAESHIKLKHLGVAGVIPHHAYRSRLREFMNARTHRRKSMCMFAKRVCRHVSIQCRQTCMLKCMSSGTNCNIAAHAIFAAILLVCAVLRRHP